MIVGDKMKKQKKHCVRMGCQEYMAFSGEVNYGLKATGYFLTCPSNVLLNRTTPGCAKRMF